MIPFMFKNNHLSLIIIYVLVGLSSTSKVKRENSMHNYKFIRKRLSAPIKLS